MLITFHCTKCQAKLEGDTLMGGSEIKCPQCGESLTVPLKSLGPGITVGGFEIIKMLGAGGTGEVYLARQLSLGQNVTLKILPAMMQLHRGAAKRLFDEVQLLGQLEHPNIVVAFEAGEDAGVIYLARAYVNGESLEEKLRRAGPMKEADALQMIGKMAGALDYAWSKHKLLHRDIKPSNVMMTASGELKLIDFGLAKCFQEDKAQPLAGPVMGKPNYMSPEQVEGKADLDCRADLYSMGATLYHMVTGKIPFAGSSVMETLRKQASETLPNPRTINPAVSENCVTLLEIMLSKNRDLRYPDYKTLMPDVERVKAGNPPGREPPPAGQSVLLRAEAGPSRAPQSGAHGKAPAKSNRKLIIGVAVALGIGLVLALITSPTKQDAAKSEGAEKGNTGPADQVNNQSSRQDEVLARLTKRYIEALAFSRKNPDDYAGALVMLEPLGKAAAGTELEGKVKDEIGRAERVRKQAADKVITVLKAEVQAKVTEGDFDGALKRIELDTGLVTEETKSARAELAQDVKAKKQAAEDLKIKQAAEAQQQKQAAAAKEQLAALAQGVAADLLKGDASGMIRKLTAAKSDPAMGQVSGEVSELNDMALQAIDWPGRVAKTFEALKGKPVTVEFKGGRKEQFTITSVAGERIKGQKQMGTGFIGREFLVNDLSTEEKLKCLGNDPQPVMKVMRGLIMVKCANDWASAGKEFASAGGVLAEALAKEAPGAQTPAVAPAATKLVEEPAVEAKVEEAVPAESNKPDLTSTAASKPTMPGDVPEPGALKPATGETIKAAIENLEKANDGKLKYKYEIKSDGTTLTLSGNSNLRDLGAISELPLVRLDLVNTGVEDLGPLAGMPLDFLDITAAPVNNIKPLSKIKTLKILNISNTKTDDLSPLKGLQLTKFICSSPKGIRDLAPLAGMPLEYLEVRFSDSASPNEMAANIAAMKDMPLDTLALTGPVIKDIKFLGSFTSVRILTLGSTQASDLAPLRGMKSLKKLHLLSNHKVDDIKALKGMELTTFQILSMNITSLEPLAGKGAKITHLMIPYCPKLADTDKIPEYFPDLLSITIDPGFPRPESLTRCAHLQEIIFFPEGKVVTMDDFRKRYSKPSKQPVKK